MNQEPSSRTSKALADDPLISWSTRKLIELTDGRIFDCCEFELLPNPSGFGAANSLYGFMGWKLEEGLTLQQYGDMGEHLDPFYVEKLPLIVAYQPASADQLSAFSEAIEMSFLSMIHNRRADDS